MPIIFGIRRKTYRLATVFALCGLCQTPAAQAVNRVRTFFSLFFIPVVPVASAYTSTCTMCGGSVKITREAAEHIEAHAHEAGGPPDLAGAGPAARGTSTPPAVTRPPMTGPASPDVAP